MKNLPVAIHTLSKLLSDDCVYVDKTEMAWNLISGIGADSEDEIFREISWQSEKADQTEGRGEAESDSA